MRNTELKDSSFNARKLAEDKRHIVASPDYLKVHGIPKTPQELHQHQCISLIGLDNWSFQTPDGQINIKQQGQFRAGNSEVIRDAAIDGLGITVSSTWCCYQQLKSGELVSLLDDYPLISNTAIWAVYPSSRLLAPTLSII
ncbi:substrate binding domain-containing protein [Marinifaba aquimaris]|uniref:substrate binding domain-containing protein n=1 Tax=Marinifaba aquimaris TaxID=2741323 RepID=UPI0031B595B4